MSDRWFWIFMVFSLVLYIGLMTVQREGVRQVRKLDRLVL